MLEKYNALLLCKLCCKTRIYKYTRTEYVEVSIFVECVGFGLNSLYRIMFFVHSAKDQHNLDMIRSHIMGGRVGRGFFLKNASIHNKDEESTLTIHLVILYDF